MKGSIHNFNLNDKIRSFVRIGSYDIERQVAPNTKEVN